MLFNSVNFLFFFPVVAASYYLLPHRFRWALLLCASCYFYMVFIPKYILILAALITIDYFTALRIEASQGTERKALLLVSIAAMCSALFFFKYFDFFAVNVTALAHLLGWNYPVEALHLVLPIGLSFHTFQSLSYVIEVYRGNQKAERHPGIFAVYVMFFPQLVAGPIERPGNLLHQFREEHSPLYGNITNGLKLMAWGLFQKIVVADNLARFVDEIYSPGSPNTTGYLPIRGTVFFAMQIFCDFSGYSDVARGSAMVLGFRLMKNFDRPYLAGTISEFWRRWHISLSSWLRDYIYIPLGGNRCSVARMCLNLMVTFTLCGIWHGARWTYVIWGVLNGVYLVVGALTRDLREMAAVRTGLAGFPRIRRAMQVAITFILVCGGWAVFRSDTLAQAWKMTVAFYGSLGLLAISALPAAIAAVQAAWSDTMPWVSVIGFVKVWILPVTWMALVLAVQVMQSRGSVLERISRLPAPVRWAGYYGIVLVIILCGFYENKRPFIYFQF